MFRLETPPNSVVVLVATSPSQWVCYFPSISESRCPSIHLGRESIIKVQCLYSRTNHVGLSEARAHSLQTETLLQIIRPAFFPARPADAESQTRKSHIEEIHTAKKQISRLIKTKILHYTTPSTFTMWSASIHRCHQRYDTDLRDSITSMHEETQRSWKPVTNTKYEEFQDSILLEKKSLHPPVYLSLIKVGQDGIIPCVGLKALLSICSHENQHVALLKTYIHLQRF